MEHWVFDAAHALQRREPGRPRPLHSKSRFRQAAHGDVFRTLVSRVRGMKSSHLAYLVEDSHGWGGLDHYFWDKRWPPSVSFRPLYRHYGGQRLCSRHASLGLHGIQSRRRCGWGSSWCDRGGSGFSRRGEGCEDRGGDGRRGSGFYWSGDRSKKAPRLSS